MNVLLLHNTLIFISCLQKFCGRGVPSITTIAAKEQQFEGKITTTNRYVSPI